MKKVTFILLAISIIACKNSDSASHVEPNPEVNQTATDSSEHNTENMEIAPLLGEINEQDLKQEPFNKWFDSNYQDFTADEAIVEEIDKHIHDYEIVVFMGTWCSDSQRDIHQLFNLLEKVDYDQDRLKIFAVDENKQTPDHKEEEYNVAYVPTIIFMKNGEEVNRFVEFAQDSLAQDILKIVKGEDYKNPYAK